MPRQQPNSSEHWLKETSHDCETFFVPIQIRDEIAPRTPPAG